MALRGPACPQQPSAWPRLDGTVPAQGRVVPGSPREAPRARTHQGEGAAVTNSPVYTSSPAAGTVKAAWGNRLLLACPTSPSNQDICWTLTNPQRLLWRGTSPWKVNLSICEILYLLLSSLIFAEEKSPSAVLFMMICSSIPSPFGFC